MTTATPGATPEISYEIAYEEFAGREYNQELRGKGRLTIRSAGPVFLFSGRRRVLFSGERIEREYTPDQIWNVTLAGRTIRFRTKNQFGQRPFVFFCRDAAEALVIARRLPRQQDEDFVATQDFADRLNAVPAASRPWTSVTNVVIALNVAVFVLMGLQGAGWVESASMKPYVLYGANNGAATTDGEWWRLVTCMFMHYGILHLALNMWALFQVGHLLENLLGRTLYTLAYIGSGVIASLASIIWHGDKIWSAGASGAVFGAYGALLGYMLREKHGVPRAVFQPIMRSTLTFAGYNIVFGLAHPGIDNAAHVGGLVSGFVLGWLVALPLDPQARRTLFPLRLRLGLVSLALLVAAGVALAPRFAFNPAAEMRWEDTTEAFSTKEAVIVARQNKEWREFNETGGNRATYARWIERDLIPLYEPFARQLETMRLSPGKPTTHRRDVILRVVRLRLEGYRHLLVAVRNHNPAELKAYTDFDQRATAELGRLPEAKR